MIVILHNIRSLHNVGSIFRTADGAGAEKIYLCGITPAPLNKYGFANQQLAKTALGAEQMVKWEKIGSQAIPKIKTTNQAQLNKPKFTKPTLDLIQNLKLQNYKIYSIEQAKKSISYHKVKLTKNQLQKTALVLGPEVIGLPPAILKASDQILEIPMHGKKKSLNVSVAFGIVIFSLISNTK